MIRKLLLLSMLLLVPGLAFAQYDETSWPVDTVGTAAPSHTVLHGNMLWKAGHVTYIRGFVFVDSGSVLTIQAGSIIKGDPGQAENATALIIAPGAKIIAKGSPNLPIIFTTILDKIADTADLPDVASSRGLWGGLIIEGRSFTCVAGDTSAIEGVPVFPGIARLSQYGGGANPVCDDNSGILQYVSIRYPGSIMAPNVEINGLSLAAVGSGTTIDHIDVFYSADDDIECWGGNVNLLYTAIIYGDDDGWDTDECWSGIKQFGLMVKDPRWGDRETENDGRAQSMWTDTTGFGSVTSGWGCSYPSYALNANLTMIGQDSLWSGAADQGSRQMFRENYRGYWYNNVFTRQPKQAVEVDNPGVDANLDVMPASTRNLPSGAASIAAGHPLLDFAGNFWWKSYYLDHGANPIGSQYSHFGSTGYSAKPLSTARVRDDIFPGTDTTITGKNHIMDPMFTSLDLNSNGVRETPPRRLEAIDPRPAGGSPLIGTAVTVPAYAKPNSAYTPTTYVGAFEPGKPMWCQQPWCTAYEYKIIPHPASTACGGREGKPVKVIGSPAPSHTVISQDMILTADTIWHLQGFVFVDSGHTLMIEPGTTIKGDPGQAENATSLIISPGARIVAPGTKENPIIFTTWLDNVDDPNDLPDVASSRGLWGGLIIEGRSFTCVAGDTSAIEGVPVFPGIARLSQYGGGANPVCDDNSGILQYVSIRYPGSIMAPNVEINGLSLAAVGSGTTIDHIEVYYSADDDIECWGGNVNLLYTAIIYGDDDGWDTDECWGGIKQFGLMVKDPRWGDRETENDGRAQSMWTDTTGFGSVTSGWGCSYPSYALNANLTMIGQDSLWSGAADQGSRQLFRENYRAYWYNNVFTRQPKQALEVDNPGVDANLDVMPASTRNLPSGAASIAAGHPLLDFAGNFWWKSYYLDHGANPIGSQYSHFGSTGYSAKPLSTARVRDDIFPGTDTTITGKNHIMDPKLTSLDLNANGVRESPPTRRGAINPVPAIGSPLIGSAKVVPAYAQPNSAFVQTTYVGAFDPNVDIKNSWIWGWTVVSDCYGILGEGAPSNCCTAPTRGDVDANGSVDISDLSAYVDYLFNSLPFPGTCFQEQDIDNSGSNDISDLQAIIDFLFNSVPLSTCP